ALADRPVNVVTWEDVDFELVGIRDYQNALLSIVLLVVFAIVALGILNTLLMSMFERVREFGVLMAIGARPAVIRRLVVLESCILGSLGALFGLAVGCALIIYYRKTGLDLPVGDAIAYFMPFDSVLYMRFNWPSHAVALAAVLITSVLSGLPPAARASRMRPAESLRHI
ncbi:ABC transporter permease, partial [Elusimicrobiota bacterium]